MKRLSSVVAALPGVFYGQIPSNLQRRLTEQDRPPAGPELPPTNMTQTQPAYPVDTTGKSGLDPRLKSRLKNALQDVVKFEE